MAVYMPYNQMARVNSDSDIVCGMIEGNESDIDFEL